ncbi:hypothetical protein BKP37_14790 [Anaerobacillus alkalilacustris]|uniref:Uncharacterized protein n=1 Tax=Anaerobacillus alkalilacustris TaxID=393763 RepID=A0A1S2LGN2_9BACI|nr:hypothetical protein [Anaerobacillus alkalilacustris]OIJ11709.1 hypothetical protein BKP37_14790 [Anaerobacillus alkalilacustris]
MANLKAAQIAYFGQHTLRHIARFHFEIIKRLYPKLVSMPFLGAKWDERLTPYLDGLSISEPFEPPRQLQSKNLVTWQWDFMDQGWDQIREFLLGSRYTGLFDIVDFDRLSAVFDDKSKISSVIDAKEILSLIEIQYLLTNQYESKYEGNPENIELLTNIRGIKLFNEKINMLPSKPKEEIYILPSAKFKKIRIDPTNQEECFKLGPIYFMVDGEKVNISENGEQGLTPNKWVQTMESYDSYTIYKGTGNDPNFVFVDQDFDFSSAREVVLVVLQSSENGAKSGDC